MCFPFLTFLFYETLETRELFKYPQERWEFYICSVVYSVVYRGVIGETKADACFSSTASSDVDLSLLLTFIVVLPSCSLKSRRGCWGRLAAGRRGASPPGAPWFSGVPVKEKHAKQRGVF